MKILKLFLRGACSLLAISAYGLSGEASAAHPHDIYCYFENADSREAAFDSSGNNLHLRYFDPANLEISPENFKFGSQSLKVTGPRGLIKQSLNADSHAMLGQEVRKMSVVVWVWLPGTIDEKTGFEIMERDSIGSSERMGNWRLSMHGKLGLRFSMADLTVVQRQKTLAAGEWMHFAMVFDEGNVVLYVDGVQVASSPPSGSGVSLIPPLSNDGQNRIQAVFLPEGSFVDDFGFFGDRALSESEIALIMKEGLKHFVELQ